jgi:hypothetical protein
VCLSICYILSVSGLGLCDGAVREMEYFDIEIVKSKVVTSFHANSWSIFAWDVFISASSEPNRDTMG